MKSTTEMKAMIEEELETGKDDSVRAPFGMFIVCLWDQYPRNAPPVPQVVATFEKQRDANTFARSQNARLDREFYRQPRRVSDAEVAAYLMDGRSRIIEPTYLVIDGRGDRVM